MSMKALFITGTGTDVGKTVATACLARALWRESCPVLAVKPVQTGIVGREGGDASLYTEALSSFKPSASLRPHCLHSFVLPASPHLAARQEGRALSVEELLKDVYEAATTAKRPLLLEGAGGLMVPLTEEEDTLDFMQALNGPVLVVMRNGLGALNHVLLTLEVACLRGLKVLGVVSTAQSAQEDAVSRDNVAYLRARKGLPPLWELPYLSGLASEDREQREKAWEQGAAALAPLARELTALWAVQDVAADDRVAWDKAHLWHPYTSTVAPLPAYEAVRAEGTRIFVRHVKGESIHEVSGGKGSACRGEHTLIDGMASWWCAIHGYSHESLVRAAQAQAARMSHVMFGGLTHAPAVELGRKLLPLLPGEDAHQHIFLADSGSVAVEVALKMALQCQQGRGEGGRTRILAPLGGYHGDTLGAMSVCDPVNGMHSLFGKAVAKQVFVPRPSCRFDQPWDAGSTAELEKAFAEHGHSLAAAIVEPIVQGAGGMWFYHPAWLKVLHELCLAHNVLLIFDEIATGFGRTGTFWAGQHAAVVPDILCLGKALTGGFMSLAATTCTSEVASDICARGQVFMHGPTYMGNPLACAVASASLDVLLASSWQDNVARLERALRLGLAPCLQYPGITDVRVLGGIGVVETKEPVPVAALQHFFVEHGVWIRPFGRLIYLMPPYVATEADVQHLTEAVVLAVRQGVHLA